MEVGSAGRASAAEAVLVGFVYRVKTGGPVEEDHDSWAAGIAEEDRCWAAAVVAAVESQLVAAAAEQAEEQAGWKQTVLGGIRAAAEGPELPEVYPGTEKEPGTGDKVTDQPGNV